MLARNSAKYCLLIIILALVVAFTACGYRGDETPNIPPTVKITSFTGFESDTLAIQMGAAPFQQQIYWSGNDEDGVVVGYAYRVMDENGTPISTPGNSFIDDGSQEILCDCLPNERTHGTHYAPGEFTPDELKAKGTGWVVHYATGASEEYPLHHCKSKKSVWTDNIFAIINFPSNDGSIGGTAGRPDQVASSFEIVAIDNKGAISIESDKRYFFTRSVKPTITFTATSGQLMDPEGDNPKIEFKKLGQGLKILFYMGDNSVDVVSTRPQYFEYRLYKLGRNNKPLDPRYDKTSPNYDEVFDNVTSWYSTKDQPKVDELLLTKNTTPPLVSDFIHGNYGDDDFFTTTIFEARVVDLAGIVSDPRRATFWVSDEFKPVALFYSTHTFALGDYHYVMLPENPDIDVPNQLSNDGIKHAATLSATPIFNPQPNAQGYNDLQGFEWAIVGDQRTQMWFRWGYRGQYEGDDPSEKEVSEVLHLNADGSTENYFSEISYHYLSINGRRFPYPPLEGPGMQDSNLPDYLRIPATHNLTRRVLLRVNSQELQIGENTIRIMVEDLQGVRNEPLEIKIRIISPNEEKNGVLYVNNITSVNQIVYDPGHITLSEYYRDIIPANIPLTSVHRTSLSDFRLGSPKDESIYRNTPPINEYYNIRATREVIPYSLMARYEYVIYSADLNSQAIPIPDDLESLRMYVSNGGKLIISGNMNLESIYNRPANEAATNTLDFLFEPYLGFPNPDATAGRNYFNNVNPPATTDSPVGALMSDRYWGKQLIGQIGFPNATPHDQRDTALAANRGRYLSGFTYFRRPQNPLHSFGTPIYLLECAATNDPNIANRPTQAHYDDLNNIVIALQYKNPNDPNAGTAYTFGFSLYQLEKQSAEAILHHIMTQ